VGKGFVLGIHDESALFHYNNSVVCIYQNKVIWQKNGRMAKIIGLTSGVNFINILPAAFAPVDPKSIKRY
jgi:hypothetical protein